MNWPRITYSRFLNTQGKLKQTTNKNHNNYFSEEHLVHGDCPKYYLGQASKIVR